MKLRTDESVMDTKLSIVIPALNEEQHIQHVLGSLPRRLEGIDSIEYLVVDDGSTDRTSETACAAGAQVVRHARNRGVGAAFQSAVQYALENGADLMVGIDADSQFDPGEIPALVRPVLDGRADMVVHLLRHCRILDHRVPRRQVALQEGHRAGQAALAGQAHVPGVEAVVDAGGQLPAIVDRQLRIYDLVRTSNG